MRARLAALLLAGAAATLPAAAGAADGVLTGTLACGPAGTSPGFLQPIGTVLRDGVARWDGGVPGQDGFRTHELRVAEDGTATVTGHYLVGTEARPIQLAGRTTPEGIAAAGRRGPRDCRLALARAPRAAAPSPYRLAWPAAPVAAPLPRPAATCPSLPPLARDLRPAGFYAVGDPTASRVDPARLAAYRDAVAELRQMEGAISPLADRAQRGDAAAAACVLALLDRMARAGSLLGEVTPQGGFERKWALVTFALAFAELRHAAAPEVAARIAGWLRAYGDAVLPPYLLPPGPQLLSARANNHAYWAALAALASGIATRDAVLMGWGGARLKSALGDVDAEGFLPREVAREGKALHYHVFSLQPLLLGTLLLQANGDPPDAAGMAALARLVARVRGGLDDPAPFVARTGAAQGFVGGPDFQRAAPSPSDWAWAELALRLWPDPALAARIAPHRPYRVRWLGGDITLRHAGRGG